jgi:predicted alpha-1,2-mannosidase|tara:strand:- start:1042 stop:3303 length:2262 start_codon:yes stop_codon:yes gene_type:complete
MSASRRYDGRRFYWIIYMSKKQKPRNLLDYVKPAQGTNSVHTFSQGNTLPLVARPFAMTHWAPQTEDSARFYQPTARQLQGIRATHQPSPWIGDYGHFLFCPQSGRRFLQGSQRSSVFRAEDTTLGPHYFRTFLGRYRTSVEITPTERCALVRLNFPEGEPARLIVDLFDGQCEFVFDEAQGTLSGFTRANSGGVPDNYALYFYIEVDSPIKDGGFFKGGEVWEGETRRMGDALGAFIEFAEPTGPITVRIATSFISVEQAQRNLQREVGDRSFDEVLGESEDVWNAVLNRIDIEGASQVQLETFYSCLYRAHLFPRVWYEYDESGESYHYSPYDGELHPGVLYADNGFWDTHRTVYPLLALLDPDRLAEVVEGWVQAYREGGWFPKWTSPGYRACMIGTHLDAVVADACARGVTGFDLETAYAAMLKNANEIGDEAGHYGRRGIEAFVSLGWVPHDEVEHAASRTQDFAYNDFCVAQVAKALGHKDDYRRYSERAFYYRNTFNKATGFMQGRLRDGSWETPFDEFRWGGAYIEGSAWQCTWAVPHDAAGLIELLGGPQATVDKLDKMLVLPPRFEVGSYNFEIHEMTEMGAVDFGQYAHSNQPVHHVLYLYAFAGAAHRTQYCVRRVLDELYSPQGFSGDEDNGEMASWYIFSALGFYPFCPGHPSYVLGSPLFKKATVHLHNGKELVIEAPDNAAQNVYVQGVEVDGAVHPAADIAHEVLAGGCTMRFAMADQPGENTCGPEHLPFSLSTE